MRKIVRVLGKRGRITIPYLEWSGNKWAFSANGVKPNQMIGNHLGSLGVTVKNH